MHSLKEGDLHCGEVPSDRNGGVACARRHSGYFIIFIHLESDLGAAQAFNLQIVVKLRDKDNTDVESGRGDTG